jgi:hypothetical protein
MRKSCISIKNTVKAIVRGIKAIMEIMQSNTTTALAESDMIGDNAV